jgi:hypothetical protein
MVGHPASTVGHVSPALRTSMIGLLLQQRFCFTNLKWRQTYCAEAFSGFAESFVLKKPGALGILKSK